MDDLLLPLMAALIGTGAVAIGYVLSEDPPEWFVATWNAVAHPRRKGGPRG